jgi:16S rRNA processing protein RimM
MTNYCSIGKWAAVFGVKGELILSHKLGKKTSLKGQEVLFIEERKGEMLPYFIQKTKVKTCNELYIKLDGIDTREQAKKMVSKEVWLPEEAFHKYAAASAPVSFLGYILMNGEDNLGEVLEVIEQPHQLLCRIDLNGKEALIPVHQDNLEKIDKRKKQLHVVLPDGLLDIYR